MPCGALATLHLGLGVTPIEFYASVGACFYGPTAYFPVSFASYGGVTWWFSEELRPPGRERVPRLVLLGRRRRVQAVAY